MERDTECHNKLVAETHLNSKLSENLSKCSKIRLVLTNITVEPFIFLYFLPCIISMFAVANLDLEKACRVNLNFSQSICDGLSSRNASMYNKTDEETIQKAVATMNSWKIVIRSVFPAVLLLFLGSWTDRHNRRKPCMYLPILGEIIMCIGVMLCIYFFYELPMEITAIVETVPPALTGGWCVMIMSVFSYISAISSVETRTVRIGAITILLNISLTVGIFLGAMFSFLISLYWVILIALCMHIINILYCWFAIKEIPKPDTNEKEENIARNLFDLSDFTNTLKILFKSRQKNWRKRICVIFILVMVVVGSMHAEQSVVYLYARYRFGWNIMEFGIYYVYNIILHLIGTIFSISFFSKYLKLDDTILGIISCTSKVLAAMVFAFSSTPLMFYLAVVVEMLSGTSSIALRCIISKLVEPDELGKINSLFGVIESLMPLLYGPMNNLIYKATIDKFPGAFYLVGGGLLIPGIFIFLWLHIEHKRDDAQEKLENRAQKEELLTEKVIVQNLESSIVS